MPIGVGSPDVSLRWDNSLRYNLGLRTDSIDPSIQRNPLYDESDSQFAAGDINTNRLDLLSELEFVYQGRMGLRVSGSAWYDAAYDNDVETAPGSYTDPASRASLPYSQISNYADNRYSRYTRRYYRGPSGELLDAFLFSSFSVGSVAVSVKAGQHNVYWGESLFSFIHGVSYSQGPTDLRKAAATPGIEARELFLPIPQLTATAQLTDTLSLSAQYYLGWNNSRYPEGGTYFGPADLISDGPDRMFTGIVPAGVIAGTTAPQPLFIDRKNSHDLDNKGNWGAKFDWSPEWLDGTVSATYRKFDETLPWLLLATDQFKVYPTVLGPAHSVVLPAYYHNVYAQDTELYGLSLSKNVLGLSIGSEVTYRKNTALSSVTTVAEEGARGDTLHVILNAVGLVSQSPLFDTLSYQVELVYSRWLQVDTNRSLFKAEGNRLDDGSFVCTGPSGEPGDAADGCATRNYSGFRFAMTPTWIQIFPTMDLTFPVTFGIGLKGNSAVLAGGSQGNGSYSFGPALDIRQRYSIALSYNDFIADVQRSGGVVTTSNGGLYTDRGWLSLTFKTAF